ncbi:hypothetical protein D3C78_1677660 [compost metagenome]
MPIDGSLIILTTNHPEQLDPAIVRKGRVDHHWEIPKLGDPEIRDYVELMFPGKVIDPSIRFEDQPGCNVQAICAEYRHCADSFIAALPKAA